MPTTRTRWFAAVGCTLLMIAGIVGGVWWPAVDRYLDPMREFYQIPKFERAEWMPHSFTDPYTRMMNEVSRRRVWSEEDAEFVRRLLLDEPGPPPPFPEGDFDFALFYATPEQAESVFSHEGGREYAEWELRNMLSVMAWSTVQERIRLGLNVPEPTRSFATESWVDGLEDADEQIRIESASSLMYTRLIEDPAMRLRVEAVRLGDPSADVRAAVDRGLKHYDRFYHGIDPGGPIAECNTCP